MSHPNVFMGVLENLLARGILLSLSTIIQNMVIAINSTAGIGFAPFLNTGRRHQLPTMKFLWICTEPLLRNLPALMVGAPPNGHENGVVPEKRVFGLTPWEEEFLLTQKQSFVKTSMKCVLNGRLGNQMNVKPMQRI